MMPRVRQWLANGLLALISTAVALAGLEGAARLARHHQKEMRVYMRKPPAEVRHGWAMTGRILATLASEAGGRDSRLGIAYIPSRMEVNDRDWELTRLRHGVDEESYDRGAVLARLNEIASNERIPLLDLTPPLRHATGLVTWPYHDFDSHWNRIGHAVAAREVEAFLRRQGWACAR